MKQSEYKRQLQSSTNSDLEKMLQEEHKNLYFLRQKSAMKQLENPLAIRVCRKNIAKILTVLRERELKSGEQAKA